MSPIGKIEKIDMGSQDYPEMLREIPGAPKALWCAGDIGLLRSRSVSVVGSRKYTSYGRSVARMVGRRLGECGIPVVSGLAYGIDAFSHEGVLEAGGKMIGVLASGLLRMGPRRNYDLMMKGLESGGLIVSEYEPDAEAKPFTFPARNRIISGIGSALVVIEANSGSGALITAQHAAEQGRPVYAVPGNISSQFSLGSNLLIRDGATPLVIIDDLVRDLGIAAPAQDIPEMELGEDERLILETIAGHDGASVDRIAAETGRNAGLVNSVVTLLEIKGAVESFGGKIYLANR